jgi:hypothetical protein
MQEKAGHFAKVNYRKKPMKSTRFNPRATITTVFVPTPLIVKASDSLPVILPFLSRVQATELLTGIRRGDDKDSFMRVAVDLADVINSMPIFDGDCDHSIAYLHYASLGVEWFITERGGSGKGIDQAFGCTVFDGDSHSAEFGVISIRDLAKRGVECDLRFNPSMLLTLQPGLQAATSGLICHRSN